MKTILKTLICTVLCCAAGSAFAMGPPPPNAQTSIAFDNNPANLVPGTDVVHPATPARSPGTAVLTTRRVQKVHILLDLRDGHPPNRIPWNRHPAPPWPALDVPEVPENLSDATHDPRHGRHRERVTRYPDSGPCQRDALEPNVCDAAQASALEQPVLEPVDVMTVPMATDGTADLLD